MQTKFSPSETKAARPASASNPRGLISKRGVWWATAVGLVVMLAFGLVSLDWTIAPWTPASEQAVEQLLAQQRFDQAARMAERLLIEKPKDPATLFNLARARAGKNDFQGCIGAADSIPNWSIRKAAALLFAGQAFRKLGRGRDAEERFLSCISRDPEGSAALNARLELLALYALQERRDAFRPLVWETYRRLPDANKLLVMAMRLRIEFEQVRPLINGKVLREMITGDPEDPHAYFGLAASLEHAGSMDEARSYYQVAIDLSPYDEEIHERYLNFLHKVGDLKEMESILMPWIGTPPARSNAYKFVGIHAQSKRDLQTARQAFEKAVELDPINVECHHRLSQVLFQLGEKVDAEEHAVRRNELQKARDELKQAWDVFADRFDNDPDGVTLEMLNDLRKATKASGMEAEAAALENEVTRRIQNRSHAASPVIDRESQGR